MLPTIRHVRAFTGRGGGSDYHDQGANHWIDDPIATPMAKYPAYRQSRQSFGLNVLGTLVVEIEASDGTVGFSVTTGGDLALWDLLGKLRTEPVHALLGGPVRDELRGMLVNTGEHEGTRWGFRLLLEMQCCDRLQPDVGWCGGITELIKISNLAEAHNTLVVLHGSSVYSYHFVITRHNRPFSEFLMMAPKADEVVPMFHPLLLDANEALAGYVTGQAIEVNGGSVMP